MYTKFNRPKHTHRQYVTKEEFMAAIDDLNTAVSALQAEDVLVLAGLASLQAQVTALSQTIASQSSQLGQLRASVAAGPTTPVTVPPVAFPQMGFPTGQGGPSNL